MLPRITRDSYLFGVKIPPEEQHSPEAHQIKTRFKFVILAGMAILFALCILQFVAFREWTFWATMYLPLLIIPVFFVAFVPSWRAATNLKAQRGWQVSNTQFAETRTANIRGRLSALPWVWYIAGFAVIMGTILVANARFRHLPQTIATRFNTDMQPVAWTQTSWLTVLTIPLINTTILLSFALIAVLIEKAKLQIDPDRPHLSFMQHRIFRRRMGHAFGFLTITVILYIAMVGLMVLFPESSVLTSPAVFWGGMVLIHVPVVVIIVVYVKSGQGGGKIKIESSEIDEPIAPVYAGCYDDRHWRIGMFYYNPDDPATFVESRFGGNYSLNYARWSSKIISLMIIIGLIATYIWIGIVL